MKGRDRRKILRERDKMSTHSYEIMVSLEKETNNDILLGLND